MTFSSEKDRLIPAHGKVVKSVGDQREGWAPLDPDVSLLSWYLKEILLGLVVCFTQTPETIAFSLSAHIDPSQGLHSAWIVGIICAVFGGRPAMINGFSGASASAVKTFIPPPIEGKSIGEDIEYLYPSVILVGCLMIIFGTFRLGDFTVNLIGSSVMIGFSCGLAITICKAQFHFYEHTVCHKNVCEKQYIRGVTGAWMVFITVICMLIKEYLPRLERRSSIIKFIPSPLVAIMVAIFIEYAIVRPSGWKTNTLVDVAKFSHETSFPEPFWMRHQFYDQSKLILDFEGCVKVLRQGLLLFFICTIETLMVIEMMDGFTATLGNNNQQVTVLGVANILSGILGGVGGDAMVGMSILNGLNGAQGRVSSLACGVGIMILITVAYPILNIIPVSALAGIMFVVCIHIFKWYAIDMVICAFLPSKLRRLLRLPSRKVNRPDVIIIIAMVLLTYFYNLFYGILVGVSFSFIIFMVQVKLTGGTWSYIWQAFAEPIYAERKLNKAGDSVLYHVYGPLYFKSFRSFSKIFDYVNDPVNVIIYMEDGKLYDYSALEGLNTVCKEYKLAGKSVQVMHLSENAERMIRKADGSRSYGYGFCPINFQWILGDIEIAPRHEEENKVVIDDEDGSIEEENEPTPLLGVRVFEYGSIVRQRSFL
jgi:SulP family sulfate permease